MKRNKKYNKEIPKETFMNRVKHIVLLFLGIGILIAEDSPEEFQFNQSTVQASYYFDSVTINGVAVESDDWVGAFNGDVCVGARKWDTSLCNSGVCEVVAMGYDGYEESSGYLQTGDIPTFKIYDASGIILYDALPSQDIPWLSFGQNSIDNLNGVIFGCIDSNACNYDTDATIDDESCTYAEDNYDCDGNCIAGEDCFGECGGTAEVDDCEICGGDGIPTGDCDCSGNVEDCDGVCGGDSWESDCGCVASDNDGNDCDDCFGTPNGSAWDSDCGCVPEGNSGDDCDDCAGVPNGNNLEDECGVCGGDNSSCSDCAGVPNGDSVEDCAGVCGGDNSNCEDCAGVLNGDSVVDNCGVCGGSNTDCWFVDITTSVGNLGIIDSLSRIGMHKAASDSFNIVEMEEYDCENCYIDEVEGDFPQNNYIDFYFPHSEWEQEIHDFQFSARTDLRKDIRDFESYDIADFDNDASIFVEGHIYYIQQEWNIEIDTDQNLSLGNDVKLGFDFVNQISTSGDYTKIFFYRKITGNSVIEEITQSADNGGDCLSDYCITLYDYDLLSNFKIILGTDTVQPSVNIVSPLPNEIFSLEENLLIQLDMENKDMIKSLDLFFEVDGVISDTIPVPVQEFITVGKDDYYTFLNEKIIAGDFIDNVNIFIELTDVADGIGGGGYRSDIGQLTFSRNVSNIFLHDGWHLLSPPLEGEETFQDLFGYLAYDCSDYCYEYDPYETPNSGTGFYVDVNNAESTSFTGDVLPESSATLKQGWNLLGNPLVNSVEINSVIITYNNYDYNWPNAAKYGIISPTPIIYDNENGGHIGASELSTAAGFWVHSFYDDVEISFIPSNLSVDDSTKYWTLSLFAKENNTGYNFDNSIGSEIVIGIHEDAHDTFENGEDQEIFPLDLLNIFNSYSELSINNDGQTPLYRDIRSYKDILSTWDISVESINPFSDQGIVISWEKPGLNDPYDYYIDISGGDDEYCENGDDVDNADCYDMTSTGQITLVEAGNIKITSVLKIEHRGCTNDQATNHNPDALGGNDADYCNILSLQLPETAGIVENGDFDLPIELVNPNDSTITGLQFVLQYDAEMIQIDSVSLNEDLVVEDYEIVQGFCTDCIPAELSVIIYYNGTGELISGEGEIMTLSGIGVGTGSTIISLSSVQINESGVSGSSCTINLGNYLTVSGKINYYKAFQSNVEPVSGGLISTTDPRIDNTTSNESGNFIIDSLVTGIDYELKILKNEYEGNIDNYFDGLSAVDASRIARHANDQYNFSYNEKIAANVIIDYRCENDEGDPMGTYDEEGECLTLCNADDCEEAVENYDWVPNIEAGDASRVARYAAGIIEDLDDQCDPQWVFLNPDNEIMIHNENCINLPNYNNFVRNYNTENLVSDTTLIFEGIRLGDVTGNWEAPLGRENDENIVENPIVKLEVGEIVKLPLYLPNKVEIEGVDLTIQFDPEVFTLIGFNNNNSILEKSKYPTIINTESTGLFTLVSYASSTPINDNGLLGHIKFKVIGNSTRWSSITINEMKINDIQEGGFLVEGNFESSSISYGFDFQISAVPEVFALNKNYPNPFNPSTNIKFELPNDGDVKIFIYDLKGSLIDELVNGYMEAGYYNLKWDASRKASGVYFIQMIADNGNYIKMTKMMLVK